jgi:hypothetical protein
MYAHLAGICGRAGRWIREGGLPGRNVVRSEYDSAEEVTTARRHKIPCSDGATTKGDGVVGEMVDDLVEEFLWEVRGIYGVVR